MKKQEYAFISSLKLSEAGCQFGDDSLINNVDDSDL